jgi:hypothetical protein
VGCGVSRRTRVVGSVGSQPRLQEVRPQSRGGLGVKLCSVLSKCLLPPVSSYAFLISGRRCLRARRPGGARERKGEGLPPRSRRPGLGCGPQVRSPRSLGLPSTLSGSHTLLTALMVSWGKGETTRRMRPLTPASPGRAGGSRKLGFGGQGAERPLPRCVPLRGGLWDAWRGGCGCGSEPPAGRLWSPGKMKAEEGILPACFSLPAFRGAGSPCSAGKDYFRKTLKHQEMFGTLGLLSFRLANGLTSCAPHPRVCRGRGHIPDARVGEQVGHLH